MEFLSWAGWVLALIASMLLVFFLFRNRQREQALRIVQDELRTRLQRSVSQHEEQRRRLETVLRLNRDLAEAQSEDGLVRAALSAFNELVGAVGSTYVPLDDWGQPLPAFTYGEMPEPVMRGWAEHLASEHVRQRCANCQALHAGPFQACPLRVSPLIASLNIFCLPLTLGERRLGMLNLYLPDDRSLSAETRAFLGGLLDEMAIAIDAQRLHLSEISTLRQLHRLRSPRTSLAQALVALLEGAALPLDLDGLGLQLRPMSDERLSGLRVTRENPRKEFLARLDSMVEEVLRDEEALSIRNEGETWLALPLLLPDGQVLGALLAWRSSNETFSPRQQSILETVAAQSALMIENERQNLSLEYTLVIQERTRLAREIHDGLAQTLAFLKLQAAQMQTALTQNDHSRVTRLLSEMRQALNDAYHETRQAIDNLRVSPEEGLTTWLTHQARDLERVANIKVGLNLPENDPELLPEFQAQMIRIAQEALNNIRKHAHASEARVILRRLEAAEVGRIVNDWILEISDNGQGFNPEDVPVAARYGLRGMRERADLLGAEFQIVSQPNCGTTVRLFLPGQVEEVGE